MLTLNCIIILLDQTQKQPLSPPFNTIIDCVGKGNHGFVQNFDFGCYIFLILSKVEVLD